MDILEITEIYTRKEKISKVILMTVTTLLLSAAIGLGSYAWCIDSVPPEMIGFCRFLELLCTMLPILILVLWKKYNYASLNALPGYLFLLIVMSMFWFYMPFRCSMADIISGLLVGIVVFIVSALIGFYLMEKKVKAYLISTTLLIPFITVLVVIYTTLTLICDTPFEERIVYNMIGGFAALLNVGIFQKLRREDNVFGSSQAAKQNIMDYAILISLLIVMMTPPLFVMKVFFYRFYCQEISQAAKD